jgi:teichuronic acid biosynthesis glycosyltransferase TuaC
MNMTVTRPAAEKSRGANASIRLLVTAVGYPSDRIPAGAFHQEQLQLVAAAGVDVTVVVPTPWVPPGLRHVGRWRKYVDVPARQRDGDILILRPRYFTIPRENAWFAPDVSQYVAVRALHLPPPDLIHGFHILPLGVVAARLGRDWGVPFLTTALGDDVNVYPHLQSRNMRLLRKTVAEAAITFANGTTLTKEAERLTGHSVENLPIGVSLRRFDRLPSRNEARCSLGLPQDRIIALYVGRMVAAKGIGELATALDGLRDTSIVAVAVGDGPLREEFGHRENAICLGPRSAADVALAMAAADVFVLPSHSEGLPTVLLEAALANLPIITTDAPGCIELADDGRGIIVPVGNAAALAGALRSVTADPDGTRRRAAAMRSFVEMNHTLEQNTTRLVAHYRAILAKHRRQAH